MESDRSPIPRDGPGQEVPLMDGQTLQLSMGFPGLPTTRQPRREPERATTAPPRSQPEPDALAPGRVSLQVYTAVSILAGLVAVLWTTMSVPVLPTIDPGLQGTALSGSDGGLLLWVAFGFIGSLRVLPVAGSSGVWTFHFPFIAAAMVLGGPTAGGWVALLATLERRELESQPWYGVLANHSVMALAAVIGGLMVEVIRGAAAGSGVDSGLADLIAIAAGTLTLAVIANGLAGGTIMLRERLSSLSLIDIVVRSLGRMTLAEVGLAWVFVVAFSAVGWWAPLAVAIVVLLVWPSDGVEFIDPLMKLPRLRTFERELDGVLARTRRGLATGGLLLSLDLDGFGEINKVRGKDVGDEVLAEIGRRLHEIIRATDLAGRLGGDEFALFFVGVTDVAIAQRLAERVEFDDSDADGAGRRRRVGRRIHRRPDRPAIARDPRACVLMRWADLTMQEQKRAQKSGESRTGIRFHEYGSATLELPDAPGIARTDDRRAS